jgi:hypothetical protein
MKTRIRSAGATVDPKKLKCLPRGSFLASPGATEAKNTKVRISAKPGALAYQTQINQTLAQDDKFIRAVAKRVRAGIARCAAKFKVRVSMRPLVFSEACTVI